MRNPLLSAFVAASLLCFGVIAQSDDLTAVTPEDEALWIQLDFTQDERLDGDELAGGWIKFDVNGDKEVTKDEFLLGRAKERSGAVAAVKPTPKAAVVPKAAPKPTAAKSTRTTAKPAAIKAVMPAPAVFSANKISGLFYMQKYWPDTRYRESGAWYFAPDGKVYRNLTTGFSLENLAAFKGTKGTYKMAGGNLTVVWDDGQKSQGKVQIGPGSWNWDTAVYRPIEPFKSARQILGSYEGGTELTFSGNSAAFANTLDLKPDGTFSWAGIFPFNFAGDTMAAGQRATTGKWMLSGYMLTLNAADGKVVRGIAFPLDDEKTAIKPDQISFAGWMYKKK